MPAGSPDEIKVVSPEEYEANKVVPVSSIKLNKSAIELTEGETFQLEASVSPDNATDKTITWSSSDNSIASVSNGLVSTLKAGTAVITAKAGDFSANCTITVKAKVIPVSGITLNKSSVELTEGETFQLEASVSPDNASDKTISWSSSDNSIATVSEGLVSTWKAGEVVVIAKAGEHTATCTFIVKAKQSQDQPYKPDVPVNGITLDKTEVELTEGESVTLVATITPADATDKTITWSSSDESVASVVNGAVSCLKVGEAVITAKAGEFMATCKIIVKAKPDALEGVEMNTGITAIYTLQGVKVGTCEEDFDLLPEGLYIIDGQKLVKKIAK